MKFDISLLLCMYMESMLTSTFSLCLVSCVGVTLMSRLQTDISQKLTDTEIDFNSNK